MSKPFACFTKWLAVLCFFLLSSNTQAFAEKIPALTEISADIPFASRVDLMPRRQQLEAELANFLAAAAVFNARDAKEQTDAEYASLEARRTRYIDAAKAFNNDVALARLNAPPLNKPTPYTVGVGSIRGEALIENSDGSRFSTAELRSGLMIRVDTGTRVTTGPTGRIQLHLLDDTVFTIGPNSDMVIDEFVYDPDQTPRKILVGLAKGVFRWVTGKVRKAPAEMRVKLPAGIAGIRGTDFETVVEADRSGFVKLHSGTIEITPQNGSAVFLLQAGNMVIFTRDGKFGRPEPIR